jgi:Flp pilus assembly protein TadG
MKTSMSIRTVSFLRRVLKGEGGQTLMWVAGSMIAFFGVAGLTIDVGRAYSVRNQLQISANAAGLAAAKYIYNNPSGSLTTAQAEATAVANVNGVNGLTVTMTSTLVCRNAMQQAGWTCTTNPVNNALLITESVSMPTVFMRILFFNIKTLTVTAQATAGLAGAQPYNIAVIEDLTGSMSNVDSNCSSLSDFACTLRGLQGFLAAANPCPAGASTCTPATAIYRVALFGFPNMITADLPSVNACSSATYTLPAPFTVHTLPNPKATSYAPLTYQYSYTPAAGGSAVTKTFSASYEYTYGASDADANGFVSDWYQANNATTGNLNSSSSLVQAVGYTGTSTKTGCMLLAADNIALNGAVTPPAAGGPGVDTASGVIVNTTQVGEGITYLAAVIYAAQSALIAEQNLMTSLGITTKNAMIIQSDGGVNTQWIYFPQGLVTQNPPAKQMGTAPWTGNFANYNAPTPATIATGNVCGSNGTSACPTGNNAGLDTLSTTPQTPTNYSTAKIAYNLASPLSMAVGGVAVANTGLYPDFLDECQQTIIAGQTATNNGITVFSVAYGASTGNGCSQGTSAHADDFTDVTLLPSTDFPLTLNVSFATLAALTPCVEMKDTASSLQTFYSYFPSGASTACADSDHSTTSIAAIYQAIHGYIGGPKLIPNTAN